MNIPQSIIVFKTVFKNVFSSSGLSQICKIKNVWKLPRSPLKEYSNSMKRSPAWRSEGKKILWFQKEIRILGLVQQNLGNCIRFMITKVQGLKNVFFFRSFSFLKNIYFVSAFNFGSKKNIVLFCCVYWHKDFFFCFSNSFTPR
jgi:hypothetical protein